VGAQEVTLLLSLIGVLVSITALVISITALLIAPTMRPKGRHSTGRHHRTKRRKK